MYHVPDHIEVIRLWLLHFGICDFRCIAVMFLAVLIILRSFSILICAQSMLLCVVYSSSVKKNNQNIGREI